MYNYYLFYETEPLTFQILCSIVYYYCNKLQMFLFNMLLLFMQNMVYSIVILLLKIVYLFTLLLPMVTLFI